jgi:hypothetical protein
MISHISSNPQKIQMIERDKLLQLLNLGLEVKAFRFTRQAALSWLTSFPGDLEVNLSFAKALIREEKSDQAFQILEKIIKTDPEFFDAVVVASELFGRDNRPGTSKIFGMLQVLDGDTTTYTGLPDWAEKLQQVRRAFLKKQFDVAQNLLLPVLGDLNHPDLADTLHLEITEQMADTVTTLNLARLYHTRWPECMQISLILAKSWLETGNEDEAVKLLHYCAAHDAAAQVPTRLWGEKFPFRPLYPSKLEIVSNFAIPAEVAGKLGLNQLESGEINATADTQKTTRTEVSSFDGYRVIPTPEEEYPLHPKIDPKSSKPKDPTIVEVEEELKKVAEKIKQPSLSSSDNRFPAYVILCMKKGLEQQYGVQSTQVILGELKKLAKCIQEKNGWSAFVFLPDDLETCGKYGITPIDALDPWKIKLGLVDLDKSLSKTGERIGSVLIIGGESVVPFHKLPNPTEDTDVEVISDSPYASMDTNYFVSDWPVGRLPGETGEDTGLLLAQIRNAIQYHSDESESQTWVNQIFRVLLFWNRPWLQHFGNVGYTASIWRRSSLMAFKPIGEGKNLFLSPYGSQSTFDVNKLASAPLGYFNLHGVEDGSDWYGQKDPMEKDAGPDFPVALRPADLHKKSSSPRIVYTEACYGGHIFGKTEDQSIALTMMGTGVLAVIGSTTISYGSVTTPLIGADLIGYLVMKNLRDGMPVGEAFIKSKVEFVREMNRRQGYLDGEDQKTLISFVLYGDPLVAYDPFEAMKKTIGRDSVHPVVKTICDRIEYEGQNENSAPQMIAQAKSLVREYLPGIEYAEVKINNQQVRNDRNFLPGSKNTNSRQPNRVVVSFSKQVPQADKVHKQFAKVTLDQQGKMIKITVSR